MPTADAVLNLVIYSILRLGKQSAEFYLDYLYISAFSPDDICLAEDYQYVTQLFAAHTILYEGIEMHI